MYQSQRKLYVESGISRRIVSGLNSDYIDFQVCGESFMQEITKVFPEDNTLHHNVWTCIKWLLNLKKVMFILHLDIKQK